MVKNQFGVNIKRFRSNNARDYFNQVLTPYFQKEGIVHESSCVNNPQQNGAAEKKNGHLLESTRAFMFQKNVPQSFWGKAVLTTTHLINRLPSRILGFKSPMEMLSTFYPNLHTTTNLVPRIFGCVSFVHIHSQSRGKLDPRALKCVFVGYSSTQNGYKCYHPPSKKFYVSADVTFNEQESYSTTPYLQGESSIMEDKDREDRDFLLDLLSLPISKLVSCSPMPNPMSEPVLNHMSKPVPEIPQEKTNSALENVIFHKVFSWRKMAVPESMQVRDSNSDPENEVTISNPSLQAETEPQVNDQDLPIAVRKGTRECKKRPLYPLSHFLSLKNFSPSHRSFLVSLNTIVIPTTLSEALSNEKWKQAMNMEMEALEKKQNLGVGEIASKKETRGV